MPNYRGPAWAGLFALALAGGAAAQDTTIKFSNLWPENHYLWQEGGKVFADAVNAATGGRVAFADFHASQLGKDQLSLLNSNLAQMATVAAPYAPDKLGLTGVTELPGYFGSSCEAVGKLWPLAQEGGLLDQKEYEALGLHVLFVAVPPPYKLMTARKPVRSLEDLRGLKIRSVGGAQADSVRALGAAPVQVQAGEFYDSVSRGTVDGAIYIWVGVPPFSLQEVLHQTTEGFHAGSAAVLYAIRQQTWDGLPDEVKAAMTEAGQKAQQNLCAYQDREEDKIRDGYVQAGTLAVNALTPEEAARWNALTAGVAADWAARLDQSGRPGTEVLKAFEAAGAGN